MYNYGIDLRSFSVYAFTDTDFPELPLLAHEFWYVVFLFVFD